MLSSVCNFRIKVSLDVLEVVGLRCMRISEEDAPGKMVVWI